MMPITANTSARNRSPQPLRFPLRFLLGVAIAGALVGAPGAAAAENCNNQAGDSDEQGSFRIEERDGEKVYVIDKAITVCGKVPRPLVAYVLQARSINYQWENLDRDFLPKILESVKRDPF